MLGLFLEGMTVLQMGCMHYTPFYYLGDLSWRFLPGFGKMMNPGVRGYAVTQNEIVYPP